MSAGKTPLLIIDQRADWFQTFQYTDANLVPISLAGYTAELQMRSNPNDTQPAMSLTVGSGITITAATGLISCTASNAITKLIPAGYYWYDLIITSGSGVVTRIVYGQIQVTVGISQ